MGGHNRSPGTQAETAFGRRGGVDLRIAQPERRQEVQGRILCTPVVDRDLDQNVVRRSFGILHEDIEVGIAVKDPGVEQLILEIVPGPPGVDLVELAIGKGRLRILVEELLVGVSGRVVEVEVVFIDVLPVVSLSVAQAEKSLLEVGVFQNASAKQSRCFSSLRPARPSSPQR